MKKKILRTLLPAVMVMSLCLTAYANEPEKNYMEVDKQANQSADAVFTEFKVIGETPYTINMYHSYQGPLCDAAFAQAQGNNWLVTDFFNVSVNNNLNVYEIPSEVKIRVKIPKDLQKKDRTWWMICVSRNGVAYTFEDEDDSDETITWTANRFYAYAMCYTDEKQEEKEEPVVVKEVDENPRSRIRSIKDSQTITGLAEEDLSMVNTENIDPVVFYGDRTNRLPWLKSNMTDSIERQKDAGFEPIVFTM